MARTPPTGSVPSRRQTTASDTPNDRPIIAVASAPETVLDRRRPTAALMRNPMNGRSGISSSTQSPLQRREHVGTERLFVTEERDDDRQPDSRLGRRHCHDEEHDDLPVDALVVAIRGHERE